MAEISRFVLWGSAGHAKVLADIIRLEGGRVVALFDNDPCAHPALPEVPLYIGKRGFSTWAKETDDIGGISAVIAIGGARGRDRHELYGWLKGAGLSFPVLFHPQAAISDTAEFGEGCQILACAVVAADSVVGSNCIINNRANVDHECRLGIGVHVAPGATLCGCVTVGDYAMIGAGAVILPRIRVGAGAIVGAGAVVTRDVPPETVVVGNPAKKIGVEND